MAGGSKLIRVCTCEEYAPDALELHAPQLFCPVCQLWSAVRQLASGGEQLSSGRAGRYVLTELRVFAGLKVARRGPSGRALLQERRGWVDPGSWGIFFQATPLGRVSLSRLSSLSGLGQ